LTQAYIDLCALTMRLHLLIADSREEEADAVRDEMDIPWRKCTEAERKDSAIWSALMYEFENYKLGKPVVRDKHFVDNNSREEKTNE
jgi:hypothetical protein